MSWFARTLVIYASCPSEIINSDSFHLLSIPVWRINYVVVLLIFVLFADVRASYGTRKAAGCVVKPRLWAQILQGSDVFNLWV